MSPLKSDITLPTEKFGPAAIPESALKANQQLLELSSAAPNWWDVGAARFRTMRAKGEAVFPAPALLPTARSISIPSRTPSRTIPCRLLYPNDNSDKKACQGIIMHMHGGGWVLFDEKSSDELLKQYADASGCVVISVGYRLAPEDPFPAGPEDCFDVAEYLVDRGAEEYGGSLKFIGGESAGAHLSLLTTFHLLRTRPSFRLLGLLLHFGCFDIALPRSTAPIPILTSRGYDKFIEAFVPPSAISHLPKGLYDPSISPYYEDLEQWRGKLPSALFTVGTVDILLSDTVLMSTKWLMHGGEAVTKIFAGAVHGYILLPKEMFPQAKEGMEDTLTYIKERMATVS